MAGALVGLAGAAVGWGLVGTTTAVQVGWVIGTIVGQVAFGPDSPEYTQEGPRLTDLKTQTSEWGKAIPRVFGTYKLPGNVIWSLPLKETRHEEEHETGGKGGRGGTKTTEVWYSYSGTWASAFCEGEITGISKIWFDSVLVFDNEKYDGGLRYNNHTVYKGSATQEIDWIIQADKPDTPAYRHMVYIVFDDIELENYGNRIPNVSVEVVKNGTIANEELGNLSTSPHGTSSRIIYSNSNYIYTVNYSATKLATNELLRLDGSVANTFNIVDKNNTGCEDPTSCTFNFSEIYSWGYSIDGSSYLTKTTGTDPVIELFIMPKTLEDCCNSRQFEQSISEAYIRLTPQGEIRWITLNESSAIVLDVTNGILHNISEESNYYVTQTDNTGISIPSVHTGTYSGTDIGLYFTYLAYYNDITYIITLHPSNIIITKYSGNEFISTETSTNFLGANNTNIGLVVVDVKGIHIFKDWNYTLLDFSYDILFTDTIPNGSGNMSGEFMYYNDNILYEFLNTGTIKRWKFGAVAHGQTSLGAVLTDIFDRAKIVDYDVTEGTDSIDGYMLTKPMTTRAAIEPLLTTFFYDLIEYDYKIQLKKRDATVVNNIDDFIGELENKRQQTVELSKQVTIQYSDSEKNYEPGSQSALLIDSDSKKVTTYQFPIVLDEDKAKQVAEVLLYTEWLSRHTFEFNITNEFIDLEPGDVITLENGKYKVRIVNIDFNIHNTISIKAVSDRSDVYTSLAIGSSVNEGTLADSEILLNGPTFFQPLDIPLLSNKALLSEDTETEGIYLAATGFYDHWPGCIFYKSTDLEASYKTITGTDISSVMGETIDILADVSTTDIWDRVSTVTVHVKYGSLYSSTELQILKSTDNAVLLGDEIVQYVNATDNLDGTYTLDTFLRGKRGTEWATGTHAIGERFVLLSSNLLFDSTASLNVETYYKAATIGDYLEDVQPKYIVPEIRYLKPFSPSYVRGIRDGSNNLTIQWMRRTRFLHKSFLALRSTFYLSNLDSDETFEIDILDTDDTVLATKTTTSEDYVYTSADQLVDNPGMTPGDPIKLIIYQISKVNSQRGYGTQEIL